MGLKLGIIGTNWITKMFVEAAMETQKYQLHAVYSRHQTTGEAFANEFSHEIPVFTNLDTFLQSGIEVVYIASPNRLHFEQVKAALNAGIEVIVEKSAFDNVQQYEEIYSLLQQHPKQHLFEAARHVHQDNFKAIEAQVAKMPHISGATLVYEKYSSRFDAYLAGEVPNVLSPEFSAGALTDLGIYPLYAAIKLFGLPKEQFYFATMLTTGSDGRGTVILRYDDFDVTLIFGKGANSYLASEILGYRDTITIDNIAELNDIQYNDGQGEIVQLGQHAPANPMVAEAEKFAAIMLNPEANQVIYDKLILLSQRVNLVLTKLRQSAGIQFPTD
ncbi:Gfo/Idh/MocA family oxidoreductase [Weissella diestrammenae]|uniref:Gfo/Idh/MocA family oxidoreductase n=1 Tax=Weissella diestrammenae TaxID=1162633 RepID=A0A7G9T4B0_9LACO|nr:Gfo/Idh/MocA family oxidoreductase [Weissella diestrammenae]MCM0583467.1 Gfo/Idh/MocA family oxidoreductase [Weissella diestrammenae]QNN74935.1 Gfo/Idh/MocA family oxidoreductase [Weissella diestrammenae]